MKIYWNKEKNSKNLIGQRVKELRTEKHISQKALAEQLQLAGYEFSDLTVLRIEQGTRFVPDYEVVALAEFFHVSCEYLLGVKKVIWTITYRPLLKFLLKRYPTPHTVCM